jgi:pyruvate dehydrogenase E2 component (dihydrolipoamide acetyltransferase)
MKTITLPRLGSTMAEGTIVAWRVKPGDSVSAGDVLYEVTTDKVNMEVEADYAGRVQAILVPEGQTVAVGTAVAVMEGEQWETLAGTVPPSDSVSLALAASGPSPKPRGVRASPAARRLARRWGVALETIVGSGPQGRIVRRDLEARRPSGGLAAKTEPTPSQVGDRSAPTVRTLKSPDRRAAIAQRMSEAARIPQVTLMARARMGPTVALYRGLKQNRSELGVSVVDFVLLAVARALGQHPDIHGWLIDGARQIPEQVDLGYAVDAPEGLVVVTLAGANRLTLAEIAARRRELTQKALEGRIAPDDVQRPSFTVSNLGMLGIEAFTPLLYPPQVGILGVGALTDAQSAEAADMTFSLTFDHRALDGAPAARFLQTVCRLLEIPALLL